MKSFIKTLAHTLLQVSRFFWRYILRPLLGYCWLIIENFFLRHRQKLTRTYWQTKAEQFRRYNWQKAHPRDLLMLWPGFRLLGLYLLLYFFIFYLAVYIGLFGGMPSQSDLREVQNNTASEVYSADGVLLGRYYVHDRTNIKYEDIAPAAIEALVATEDVRFYEHNGIDVRSSLRVLIKSLLLGQQSGGGSTLSQQLAKNLYPRRNYWLLATPVNKLREMIIARKLEAVYTKKEILELYLNTVPMGGNLYGIERSARRFFNKPAGSLKTEEAAVLIGILKATTTYNPRLDPARAKERRNVVLNQMAKYGFLTTAKKDSLKQRPLTIDYTVTNHNDGLAPYFREQLRQELTVWLSDKENEAGEPYNLYTDGLLIYTTLDAGMQRHAELAVRRQMARLQRSFDAHWRGRAPWGKDESVVREAMARSGRYRKMKDAGASDEQIREAFAKKVLMNVFSWSGSSRKEMSPLDSLRHYARMLNAGLLSMEPQTGYVRAWVGGINHHVLQYDHVRATRQVGSTFKPIVYAAALEQGIAPCAYYANERKIYTDYDDWSPQNASGRYGGKYSMGGALAQSVNTVSAQLILEAGIEQTVALARRFGIKNELPEVPSLALGTANLSLLEMVSAYATFASDGKRVPPVYIEKITDRHGKVLRRHVPQSNQEEVLSEANAAIMLQLLQGVVTAGSAGSLRTTYGLRMDIASKTGTTQDHADGWFIGITPRLVTGVWVGAESPKVSFRTLEQGQGARTALPVWGEFMRRVAQDPDYPGHFYSRFDALPPGLASQLACAPFLDDAPAETENDSFLDRLFDRFRGKKQKDESRLNRKEEKKNRNWERRNEKLKKEEEKLREKRKKQEEKRRQAQKRTE